MSSYTPSPPVWQPPPPWHGTVGAPTVFLPFEPIAPVLPPPAFRRFEFKPEPWLPAPQRDLQAPRATVRSDRPRRMQTAHPHRTRRQQPARNGTDRRQAAGLNARRDTGSTHGSMIPRSGDRA